MAEKELNRDRVKEIFDDAYSLYGEAMDELERGNIRESAEKAWGATLRATKALILARMGKEYAAEVDPDLDDLVFVILRQRGILVNVRVIDFTVRLSVEQEVRLIARLLGKWVEITPALRMIIEKNVLEKSPNGVYEAKNNAVVMWWKVP